MTAACDERLCNSLAEYAHMLQALDVTVSRFAQYLPIAKIIIDLCTLLWANNALDLLVPPHIEASSITFS